MKRVRLSRRWWLSGPIVILAIALLLVTFLALSTAAAMEAELADDEEVPLDEGDEAWLDERGASPSGVLGPAVWAGRGEREVGVEYVANYPGTAHDLPNAANNAWGFYNILRWYGGGGCSWYGNDCYIWGNANAWEEDFKRTDRGGTNNNWVDDVDIVFYEGHGNPSLFTFKTPTGGGTHDDSYLTYTDARRAWGDKDAEYIALLSCSVLADSHEVDWSRTMYGLHLLLGFETTAYDVRNFGARFAWRIVAGDYIRTAWFRACDTHQPSGVRAKVLANEYAHFFDTWYNRYGDSWDYDYRVVTHPCGATSHWVTSNLVSPGAPQEANQVEVLPVFYTPPLSLAEQQAEWGSLTSAFEMPTQTIQMRPSAPTGDYWVSVIDGRELEMDTASGQFYYIDHNKLYSTTASSQARILAPSGAKDIADQFLTSNGLMPADAQFTAVLSETVETVEVSPTVGMGPVAAQVVAQTVTDYQVYYSRIMTYTTTTVQGGALVEQVHEVAVVGPGSKLKVYVDAGGGAARVAAPGQFGAVVGAMGGWRSTTEGGGASAPQAATVPLLAYDQIEQLFYQLEPQVALEHVPFDNPTHKEIISYTVGEWEEPTGLGQAELFPTYVLKARYEGEVTPSVGVTESVVVTDFTYIPANQAYMRPLARIDAHSDLSKNYWPGQVITATAADASLPLVDLGYHDLLTFTLGSDGLYIYDWYRDNVAAENHIGSSRDLVYTITTPSEAGHAVPVAQTIILQVTDVDSAHASQDTSVTSTQVNVIPPVFLPLILRSS